MLVLRDTGNCAARVAHALYAARSSHQYWRTWYNYARGPTLRHHGPTTSQPIRVRLTMRARFGAFATRTNRSSCEGSPKTWPMAIWTSRCSTPNRPISTSTRESALPAWPGAGQTIIPTPDQIQDHFLAGALNARTATMVSVEYKRRYSLPFIHLARKFHRIAKRGRGDAESGEANASQVAQAYLPVRRAPWPRSTQPMPAYPPPQPGIGEVFALAYRLNRIYRLARRIMLILDNSVIHKSSIILQRPTNNPKFELLFLPVYHPWINLIGRLWKVMHETVTCNHHHRSTAGLMGSVRRFAESCQSLIPNTRVPDSACEELICTPPFEETIGVLLQQSQYPRKAATPAIPFATTQVLFSADHGVADK